MPDLFPNPFRPSSVSDLYRKEGALGAGFLALQDLVFVPVVIAVAAWAVSYLKAPEYYLYVVIAASLVGFLVKVRAFFAFKNMSTEGTGESYLQVRLAGQLYRMLLAAINAPIAVVAALLVISPGNSKYADSLNALPYGREYVGPVIVGLSVALPAVAALVEYVRYHYFRAVKTEGKNVAEVGRSLALVDMGFSATSSIAGSLPLLAVCILIPWYIVTHSNKPVTDHSNLGLIAFFAAFAAAGVAMGPLQLLSRWRAARPDLSTPPIPSEPSKEIQGERLVAALYGIMNSKTHGFELLGAGKMQHVENTLFITDKRLLIVEVPVAGGDAIIDTMAYSNTNFFWNRTEIKANGEKLIKAYTFGQILKQKPESNSAIEYAQVKEFDLKKMQFVIKLQDGSERRYLFMDKEYADTLKSALSPLLGERFHA